MVFIYPKKTFVNDQGEGEIFSCDLTDDTGSITLIGFNAYALLLTDKIRKNTVVELKHRNFEMSVPFRPMR